MTLKDILSEYKCEEEFEIYGNKITISPSDNVYCELKKKYNVFREWGLEFFVKKYNSYNDIEELLENIESDFRKSFSKMLTEMNADLISIGILNKTEDDILKMDEEEILEAFYEVFNSCKDCYDTIVGACDSERLARELRKESRGRWQTATYGQGVSPISAWNNQLEASVMNGVEGLAHSLVNAVGNSMSENERDKRLNKIFTDKEIKRYYFMSLEWAFDLLVQSFFAMLCKYKLVDFNLLSFDKDTDDKESYLQNLGKVEANSVQFNYIAMKLLKTSPYDEDVYFVILHRRGDMRGELHKYAEKVGFDLSPIVDNVLLNFLKGSEENEQFKNVKNSSELEALFIAFCKYLNAGENEKEQSRKYIESIIEKFNKAKCTVGNIQFSSEEEAELAKKEQAIIDELFSDLSEPNEDSDLEYEKTLLAKKNQIESLQTAVKEKAIDKIDSLIEQFNEEYLHYNNKTFNSKTESSIYRVKVKIDEYISDDLSYDKVLQLKNVIPQYLDEFDIPDDESTAVYDYYKKLIRKSLTIREIEFDSYDDYIVAEQEDDEISKMVEPYGEPTAESTLVYEKDLKNLKVIVDSYYHTKIKEVWIATIDQRLSKFNNVYMNVSGKICKTRIEAGQEHAYQYVKKEIQTDNSYENIISAKQRLIDKLPEWDIEECDISKALAYWEQAEKSARLFKGILFDTYEMCEAAKEEDKKLSELMSEIPKATKDSTLSYERMLMEKKEYINNNFETAIKKIYLKKCDDYLADFDSKFRTVTFFKANTREEAVRKKALSFVMDIKINNQNDIISARKQLEEFLYDKGVTIDEAIEANEYLDKISNEIENGVNKSSFSRKFDWFANKAAAKIKEKNSSNQSIRYCSNCGSQSDNNNKFCSKCGSKID